MSHTYDANPNVTPEPALEIPPITPNGADHPKARRVKKAKAPSPPVDEITGEPIKKPLPEDAAAPPFMPTQKQKVADKLGLDEIRKTRSQVTATVGEAVRIPVLSSFNSEPFIRAHPSFGGLDDPLPIWSRPGVGKSSGGLLLVKPRMVDRVRAHGGKVAMCGLWWCQYSVGGQFLAAVNLESDNDWIVSKRKILEASRREWLKAINAGNCWNGLKAPSVIEAPLWPSYSWTEVLNLAFDEAVDEDHPAFQSLVYGGHPPVVKG
jgi:hypothetical protein